MQPNRDFQVFYDREKIRSNANISGDVLAILTSIEMDGLRRQERVRRAASLYPEGDPRREWCLSYSDPWALYPTLYAEWTRSKDMLGSDQVMRSFQSAYQAYLEESGSTPDLFPRVPEPQRIPGNKREMVRNGSDAIMNGIRDFRPAKAFGLKR